MNGYSVVTNNPNNIRSDLVNVNINNVYLDTEVSSIKELVDLLKIRMGESS